jgi:hypothetical protein
MTVLYWRQTTDYKFVVWVNGCCWFRTNKTNKIGHNAYPHGLINYIDTKAKCRHLTKFTIKGTLRQVFFLSESPPLLGSLWGGLALLKVRNQVTYNFCSPTGLNTPTPSQPHPVCIICILYFDKEWVGGGELNRREGYSGNIVNKAWSKIPTWLTVSLLTLVNISKADI